VPATPLEVDDSDEPYRVRRKARKLADNSEHEQPAKGSVEGGDVSHEEFERITVSARRLLEGRECDPSTDRRREAVLSAFKSEVGQIHSSKGLHSSCHEADEAKEPESVHATETPRQVTRERAELIKETDGHLLRMKAASNEADEESFRRSRQQEQLERTKIGTSDDKPTHPETFQSKEVQRTEKRVASDESQLKERERHERDLKRLRLYEPTIRGHKIGSFAEFNEIVDRDFPGARNNELFNRYTGDVEKHFRLRELVGTNDTLEKGDIARLAREIGKEFTTTKDWLVKGKWPKDYELLHGAISKSEAAEKIERLTEMNGGIRCMEDVRSRLANYYAAPEYQSSPNYQRDLQNAERYFRFLGIVREGGFVTEIGRTLGISEGQARRWLEGKPPWMIKLAACIPYEKPEEGYVWLPMTTGHKNSPNDFIQVPLDVRSYRDIETVVGKLKPLEGTPMNQFRERFGPTDKADSFMYSLGVLLSDGHAHWAPDSNLAGSQLVMGLGRAYRWSLDYGDGTSYHLGMIGLHANRIGDQEYRLGSSAYPSKGSYRWQSENSPFITWMRRSCIGIPDGSRKTDTAVEANWILGAPENWRASFLRGICDGDGWASIPNQEIAIATACNSFFLKQLLSTFGITAHEAKWKVVVNARDSLDRATELGLFKYAEGRKSNLEKMGEIRKTFNNSITINEEQQHLIENLRAKGMSWGRISEMIYDKYGYSWRYDVIMRRMGKLETMRRSK